MQYDERSASDDTMIVEEGVECVKPSVIVVGGSDHDPVVLNSLPLYLYRTTKIASAEKLLDYLQNSSCDIVIVDAELKDSDIVSLVRALALNHSSFMLFVRSETDDEIDRVLALELGADDCVAFSCGAREIRARVSALLRRQANKSSSSSGLSSDHNLAASELRYQGWVVNRDRCQLYSPSGNVISLTSVEYGILIGLFSDPGSVKDRSSLRNIDSDESEYDLRSLDVFVSRLRKKMAHYGGQDLIVTVRGRGYRLG